MENDINKILATKRDWRKAERRIEERRKKYGTPHDRKDCADMLREGRKYPHVDQFYHRLNPITAWFNKLMRKVFPVILIFLIHIPAHAQEIPLTVRIAESQLGRGEIGGKNQGPIVEMYTKGQDVSWCAAFVSWTLTKAHKTNRYLLSAKSYWRDYRSSRVTSPRSGDIICFYRGGRRSGLGHVGIIENVRGEYITTIEGNVGRYPAKVKREHYRLGHINNLLGFIRI